MRISLLALILIPMALQSCKENTENKSEIIDLSDNWFFYQEGENEKIPAEVPGTVHTDLMQNNRIPDPFIGKNEDLVQWIEDVNWIYETNFQLSREQLSANNLELVFEGLDTYADVFLNDSLIVQADNMFISWEKACREILVEGNNHIRILFHSPVKKGMEKLRKLDYVLIATNEQAPADEKTNVFTRKAPFHYGWDWGPRLVTSGIWRPVYLRSWNELIIRDIHLKQKSFGKDRSVYEAILTVESDGENSCQFEAKTGNTVLVRQKEKLTKGLNEIILEMEFENPKLWWPNGLGEAYLYDLHFSISKGNTLLAENNTRLGIRSIELVQEEDSLGRTFRFDVNGIPVFMKGANYIPGDIFIPRVDTAKYQRVIRETVDANMNMLRVWGGAIYENDIFYDLCDENGILVWQDFMFACALQPGDEGHLENIRKEAEYNVIRLRNHPSMAIWCGNNENLKGWHTWGWQDQYSQEVNDFLWKTYERIFYEILPEAVAKYDSEKSYWPSSPQSYGDVLPDRKSGDEHDWSIWFGQKDFESYGVDVPRFVSEYGLQSFPEMSTINYFSADYDLGMFTEILDHRQRSNMNWIEPGYNGNDMQLQYLRRYFRNPESFEHFIYLSQLSHQLATREAIEAHRRNMPRCMGSLYWQINDCWPTISWATVDYFGNYKAAHYEAKRAFAPTILSHEIRNDSILIFGITDSLNNQDLFLQFYETNSLGQILGESHSKKVLLKGNSSTLIQAIPLKRTKMVKDPGNSFLAVSLFRKNELLDEILISPVRPMDQQLLEAEFRIESRTTDKGIEMTITSNRPARFVELITPGIKGHFSDNFFDLLPGNSKKVYFYPEEKINIDPGVMDYRYLGHFPNLP